MKILKVPYDTWSQVVTNGVFSVYHIVHSSDTRTSWAGNRDYIFKTEVNVENFTDYNSNYASEAAQVVNEDDAIARIIGLSKLDTAAAPLDRDGKPVLNLFPATTGFKTWITSRGDDLDFGPAGRGMGPQISVTFSGVGEQSTEFQFREPLEIHDGQFSWYPDDVWGAIDEFSFSIKMGPTTASPTPGSGNVNAVSLGGGAVLYVPAAGNGSHTIDLDQAIPVPASAGDGFWDCDYNSGEVTPGTPQKAAFNLFNFPIESWMLANVSMGNPLGVFDLDVYKVEWMHQRWKAHLNVKKNTDGAGECSGWVMGYRQNITRS